jgi:hypothetical protein
MTDEDLAALRWAVRALEYPSFAARLTRMVGKPVELFGQALPVRASEAIAAVAARSLAAAFKFVFLTMPTAPRTPARRLHKICAVASGAIGGSCGLPTLCLEMPLSTIIMLRAIAAVARSEGENLSDPATALSCIQVFALGGQTGAGNAAENGYFVVRGMLAKSVTEAARFMAERGLVEEGAPVLVRLMAQVASRFGLLVSERAAAQAIPLIGALGAAAVNYVFVDHYQDVARGHFAVRRLERTYGKQMVRAQYEALRRELR